MMQQHSSGEDTAVSRRRARLLVAIALLGCTGVSVALELSRLHHAVHVDPEHQSWCAMGATLDCGAVERSPFAVLFGAPVAAWGALGYALLIGVALSGLRRRETSSWPAGALLAIGGLFTVVAIENAYVSFVILRKVCLFCCASYAVNVAVLFLAAWLARTYNVGLGTLFKYDLHQMLRRWPYALGVALVFAAIAAALMTLYPRYWDAWAERTPGPGPLHHDVTPEGWHWVGARQPELTIVEFSDYECPFCARSHAVVRRAVERYPEQIRLIHRHFPLDESCNELLDRPFHRYACAAALAVHCAAAQGKFWHLNDLLYASQAQLNDAHIEQLGRQLELNPQTMRACVEGPAAQRAIELDIEAADSYQSRGTPLYIINGEVHRGALTAAQLDQALSEQGIEITKPFGR